MNLLSLLAASLLTVGFGGVALQEKITTTNSNDGTLIVEYSQDEDMLYKYLFNMVQGDEEYYTILLSYYGPRSTYSYTTNYSVANKNIDLEYIVSYPIANNLIQEDFYFCVIDTFDYIICDGYSWTFDTWNRYYYYLDYAFNSYSYFIDYGIYQNYLFDSPNALYMWYFGTLQSTINITNPSTLLHMDYNPYDELFFRDITRMALLQTSNVPQYQLLPVGFHTDDNVLTFYEFAEGLHSFVYYRVSIDKLSSLQGVAYQNGYNQGFDDGKQVGYQEGLQASGYSFLDLFGAVADTPVIMVRNLFSFDLFGFSALTVIMTMFTALILFYIFRKII